MHYIAMKSWLLLFRKLWEVILFRKPQRMDGFMCIPEHIWMVPFLKRLVCASFFCSLDISHVKSQGILSFFSFSFCWQLFCSWNYYLESYLKYRNRWWDNSHVTQVWSVIKACLMDMDMKLSDCRLFWKNRIRFGRIKSTNTILTFIETKDNLLIEPMFHRTCI